MFSATQTVQLLYRCVLRLLGSPEQHAAAEEAFAQSAAWGASVEAILVVSAIMQPQGGSSVAAASVSTAGSVSGKPAGSWLLLS